MGYMYAWLGVAISRVFYQGTGMETRNLIKFGKNSYVLTLPSSWIKKNKLEKGDSIFVKPSSNDLLISSTSADSGSEKETIIETNGKDLNTVLREIFVAYVNNSKVIEVRGEVIKDNSDIITNFLQSFMALEILEQTSNKIVVRDFLRFEDVSIINITKRIDNIIRVMLKDCTFSGEDISESLAQRDQSINRLYYLLFRITRASLSNPHILSMTNMSAVAILDHWDIVQSLEVLGDTCKRISKGLSGVTTMQDKKMLVDCIEKLDTLYRESMKSYYVKDKNMADKLSTSLKDLWKEFEEMAYSNKSVSVSYVASVFREFVVHIRSINKVTLNQL